MIHRSTNSRVTRIGQQAVVRLATICLATWLAHCASLSAQDAAPADPGANWTVQKLQERLKRIDESPDLDSETKPKIVDLYKGAIEQLKAAGDWEAKITELQQRKQNAPAELKKLKSDLETPHPETVIDPPKNATLAQLEQKVADAEAAWKADQKRFADYDDEPKRRRTELPGLLAGAQDRLKEVDQELGTLPPASDTLDLSEARRAYLLMMKRSVQAELTAYENERVWFEANTELVTARQDAAALALRQSEAVAKRYRELLNEQRQQEAMKQAEEARRAAVAALPQLKAIADKNAELTQEQNSPEGFPARIAAMSKEVDDLKRELSDLRAKFARVRERIDVAGISDAVGMLLQKHQADLPDLRLHRQQLHQREAEASRVRAKLIELEDQRAELADLDKQVHKVMDSIDHSLPAYERDEIESALRELLKARRGYLKSQISAGYDYMEGLGINLNLTEKNLIEEVERYKEYISERILWLRSAPAIGALDLPRAWDGLLKVFDGSIFWTALQDMAQDARDNPGVYIAAAFVLLPLAVAQRRLRRRILAVDEQTAQAYAADIRPTIEVAALTALIAVLWPATIAWVSWRLTAPDAASLHAQNIAYGLRVTAMLFLTTEVLRQICRRKGLAEAHFGWPAEGLALVRRHLRWAMLLGLPLSFLVTVVESPEFDVHRSPLGRLAFICGQLMLAVVAHFVMHPRGGLMHTLSDRKDVSWFWRRPRIWYMVAVSGPVTLAGVAAAGYFYTALELAWRLHATMWLLLGLLVAQAFAQRCLLVARRKLAIKQARERRAAALAPTSHAAGDPPAGTATRPVDLVTIDLQTRRLLRSVVNVALAMGCWLIWVDVLPALGILDRCQLWAYSSSVHEKTSSSGDAIAVLPKPDYVTLRDLLLCGVVLLMTVVGGRNLPGLLEIAFLQRLPMDPGGRYAITTVSRYAITLVGVAIAFWTIGIGWSNVQWLVAAMTVGLGFGLQEIFANFVSGLIILFERPMRVGDTVTIGGISGTVSRIRIRATTITDGDRKELIVPNKEFITGQLMNWTLSDTILRMVIRIGVAHGSDIAAARQILLQAAEEEPRVLRDPPATAVLDQFTESALNFELRLFVGGLDAFADIRHDLNSRIDYLFHEAGIEMAVPQRDLHMRSLEAVLGMVPRPAEPLKRAS